MTFNKAMTLYIEACRDVKKSDSLERNGEWDLRVPVGASMGLAAVVRGGTCYVGERLSQYVQHMHVLHENDRAFRETTLPELKKMNGIKS